MKRVMQGFSLTPSEIKTLRSEHRQIYNKAFAYRINAVLLLGTGWTQSEVSEALLLDEDTLRRLVQKYRKDGIAALISNSYKGGMVKISLKQQRLLSRHLEEKLYQRTRDIIAYVKREYGVTYSVNGMNHLLHRLGFAYKKPKVVPGKADPAKQAAFLKKYRRIKRTKGKNDPIFFLDGTHPHHNSMPSYGWIKKGFKKELKTNSGRQRVNINGALNIENFRIKTRYDESINAQSTIKLLSSLEKEHPESKRIYVVCDNARYYRSKMVKSYLKDTRIRMLYLPAYSPNLNLIERLWKFYHRKVLYNQYVETFQEFRAKTVRFFKYIRKYKDELSSLLTENFEIIGATTP